MGQGQRAVRRVTISPVVDRVPRVTTRGRGTGTWPLVMVQPLLVATLLAVAAAVTTVDVIARGPLTELDHSVATWAAGVGSSQHRDVAAWVAVAGQRGPVAVVVLAVVAVLAWRRRSWRPLLVPVVAIGALNVVVGAMKVLIGRTAPYSGRDEVFAGATLFPSGHSANSVLMWGALLLTLITCGVLRHRWLRVLAVAVVVVVSLLVGAASVVLATHWVTDIVAGWLVGGALLAALGAVSHRVLAVRPREP